MPGVSMAQGYGLGGFASGHSDNPNGPTVSPYLNLLQGNAGLPNYQTLVKPLVDSQAAINQQASSIRRLQNRVGGVESALNGANSLRTTGHPTFFMNHSHFFPAAKYR